MSAQEGCLLAGQNQILVVLVYAFYPSPNEENSACFTQSATAGEARTKISDSILTQAGNNEREGALFLQHK